MLEHVAMMVYDVASDYGESIERGRIVNIVEYHDSMGFLTYAAGVATAQRQGALDDRIGAARMGREKRFLTRQQPAKPVLHP